MTPPSLDDLLHSACATATAQADRVPAYMLFILDGSGSMRQHGKWAAVVPALDAIFKDLAQLADPSFGAGLTIFGDLNDHTIGDYTAGPYNKMDVPVAYVDATQLAALEERLLMTAPYLGTPTYEVLNGQFPLLAAMTAQAPLLSGGKRVVVFMTDGVPDTDMPAGQNEVPWSLALVQKESTKAMPQIPTFVVGVGPFPPVAGVDYSPSFLGDLAVAGGTRRSAACAPHEAMDPANLCYFQITPPDAGDPPQADIDKLKQQFIDAINEIRTEAMSCEYTLQRVNNGHQIDPANINVFFTNGQGKQALVPRSPTQGWTYDDPNMPTKVVLHGMSCDQVKADPRSRVTVIIGCQTVVIP